MDYQFNLTQGMSTDKYVNSLITIYDGNFKKVANLFRNAHEHCGSDSIVRMTKGIKDLFDKFGVPLDYELASENYIYTVSNERWEMLAKLNVKNIKELNTYYPYLILVDSETFVALYKNHPDFFKRNRATGVHLVVVNDGVVDIPKDLRKATQYRITYKKDKIEIDSYTDI